MPIDNHKVICRDLAPKGWAYTGYDDGFYLFQRQANKPNGFTAQKGGWLEMRCLKEDLTAKNLALMAKMDLTR